MVIKYIGMKTVIKVYSHPRSGTHFLEAFLAKNFYPHINLSSDGPIYYGHWSNKKLLMEGEPHHKLFGSHYFPSELNLNRNQPKIYIYRDVRAVIASIYNSKYYNCKKYPNISVSDFLRMNIDWHGGLGRQKDSNLNIVQHWYYHVDEWLNIDDPNLLFIRYEELKRNPEKIYKTIINKFFTHKKIINLIRKPKIKVINNKVGLNPNKATIDSWKTLFSDNDISFIRQNLKSFKYLYNEI
jgi:hypothetical protein